MNEYSSVRGSKYQKLFSANRFSPAFPLIIVALAWAVLAATPVRAGLESLWITEVMPGSGEVEVSNVGTDPVTVAASLPFCHRFNYGTSIPAGTTFAPGQSRVFTVAGLSGTDSDLWLYRNSGFSSAAAIISGLKWGPQAGVGRMGVAMATGIWPSTTATAGAPSAGQSLQLTGPNPFDPVNWSAGAPNLGTFRTTVQPMPVEIIVTIENLAPPNGTYLTPLWVGFHDGTFDLYNASLPVSAAFERLVEDGATGPVAAHFLASNAGTNEATLDAAGPIAPGAKVRKRFVLDANAANHRYFSYASMVIPSNDAFISNDDPMAHAIFDTNGAFLGATFVIGGAMVYDAGTEVNDEAPANTAFFGQAAPDTGMDENGAVQLHPGFNAPGTGGILDSGMFAAADFKSPGYEVARITVEMVQLRAVTVRVTAHNPAPAQENFLTPVWLGFQDGSYDLFDLDAPASAGLESLAEDGVPGPLDAQFLASGAGVTSGVLDALGPIPPGASLSRLFFLDASDPRSRFLSFATMIIPSNDAFVGNGAPDLVPVFDHDGNFVGGSITRSQVYDAGTEVNDELPANTAFFGQMMPNTGTDENGTVQFHAGLKASGSGGIVDDPMFVNANFLGRDVLELTVEIAPPNLIPVVVEVENLAPTNGNFLTPLWAGFHDGTYDVYNIGQPACAGLESLAEDGATEAIGLEFLGSLGGTVHTTLNGIGPIAPGAKTSRIVMLDANAPTSRYLAYASMVIPSNDAFIGNGDPMAHAIFDVSGEFIGAEFEVLGSAVRDAGTEVNDELPANTAFFGQAAPNTGTNENGTVQVHAGFNAPGSGGILDDPMFAGAEFTAPSYKIARITVRRPRLTITPEDNGMVRLEFDGVLQSSTDVGSGYEDVAGAASPMLVPAAEDQRFWRTKIP